MAHIKKGDEVIILAGKEKGKKSKVIKVLGKDNRVIVEDLNIVKKHQKPTQQSPQGGIIEKEGSIHLSNVQVVCPKCGTASRTGVKVLEDGKKVRVCKKCSEVVDR